MQDINVVAISGNMARDFEARTYTNGSTVGRGVIAVNNRKKVNGQWADEASFVDFVVFGQRAQTVSQYLKKGTPVTLQGNLLQERWTSQDGTQHSRLSVNVTGVRVHARAQQTAGQQPASQGQPGQTQTGKKGVAPGPLNGPVTDADNFKDDDIPF